MAGMDLLRELRIYGGVSNVSQILTVDQAKPEPVKPKLYLTCRRYDASTKAVCGEAWESDTFSPCPKCGNRQFVTKAERPQPPPQTVQPDTVDPLGAI